MAKYVLNVNDIDEIGKDFAFSLSAAWLAGALEGTGVVARGDAEGAFDVRAQKQGKDVLLLGRVRAELETECSRCLSPAFIPVAAPVTSLMSARGADYRPPPDEMELTPEDLDREFFVGDRIVLDEIIREHLLLEVPIQPLCRAACEGIPVPASIAGPADLRRSASPAGLDPRLAPLMKLVDKLEPNEE